MSGELVPDDIDPEDELTESISVTLRSGDTTIHMTYANTTVVSFRDAPQYSCIEYVEPSGENEEWNVYRIFERPDLLEALATLGFRTVIERYPHRQVRDHFIAMQTENIDNEWAIVSEGATEAATNNGEPVLTMPQPSPSVEVQLKGGTRVLTYDNTQIIIVTKHPDMSHLIISNTGDEGKTTVLFGHNDVMQLLEEKGFPVQRTPYPNEQTLRLFTQWTNFYMDTELARIIYGDDGGDTAGVTS